MQFRLVIAKGRNVMRIIRDTQMLALSKQKLYCYIFSSEPHIMIWFQYYYYFTDWLVFYRMSIYSKYYQNTEGKGLFIF